MPYLVRMIKPNLIVSHDWHVQPNCQRSLRAVRLSGAPLDRGLLLRTGVLELDALLVFSLDNVRQHFCANFSKVSNFPLHVKRESGVNSLGSRLPRNRTAQNIKERPAKNARAARARERISLSGHAINGFVRLVLCGIPYRGIRVATNAFT